MLTTPVRVLLIRTAGTNCDRELQFAFQCAGAEVTLAHVQDVIAERVHLHEHHILGFPGGFSFGDDVAAGRIHAIELRSRLQAELRRFIRDGKLIIGICNGFQVLVNARLLPEPLEEESEQTLALAANSHNRFECRWVHLRGRKSPSAWFPDDRVITLPIAHGEGRLVPRDPAVLERLRAGRQIVFTYVDAEGKPGPYPVNPSGSTEGIAGICDASGRVLGMMPHPERFVRPESHPSWTRRAPQPAGDGLALFENAVRFARKEL